MQIQGKRMIQTQQNVKKPHFGSDLRPLGPNFGKQISFKILASAVTMYHG